MPVRPWSIIIVGGGLSGCLAALALRQRRSELPFLLIETGQTFGGNHLWSFFDTDVSQSQHEFLKPLVDARWEDHEVHFPKRRRQLAAGYNSIPSSRLDAVVRSVIPPEQLRLGVSVDHLAEDHVILAGERLDAGAVIDARGFPRHTGLTLGWQKFIGRSYRLEPGHGVGRPVIMDATVDQREGYRFLYLLPFSASELFIEDTYYSLDPDLDVERLRSGLDELAEHHAPRPTQVHEEIGLLPVVLDGDLGDLWPEDAPPIARIGAGGGFFHPTTSYSLPDAVRMADLLCAQVDWSAAAIHRAVRSAAARLWNERRFFQWLNRMLLSAADPPERYKVLEHFYRLPDDTVARFYSASLTTMDKARILTGRPPVPLGRAVKALVKAA